jgi:uncharacterized membrane protein
MSDCLTPGNVAKMEKGEVITFKKGSKDAQGKSLAQGRVLAIINKPAPEAYAVLLQTEEHPKFMPRLLSIEKYYEEGNVKGIKETIKVVLSKVTYHILQEKNPDALTLAWKLDKTKPNDIKDTSGSWQFRARDEKSCYVLYSVSVESGAFIPKAIENFLMNQDLPEVVNALKKHIETGYTK